VGTLRVRAKRRLVAAATALAVLVTVAAYLAAPAALAATTALGLTTARSVVIDPGTGRVFVSGDDRVVVLAPDGSVVGSVPNVAGAWGMDAAQGAIWVNESTSAKIVEIDPSSLAVVQTYAVDAPVGDNLAIVGNTAWIGNTNQFSGVTRFDLATSTTMTVGQYYSPAALRIPGTSAEVLIYDRGASGTMSRISTAAPYTGTTVGPADRGLSTGAVAVKGDGTKVWTTLGPLSSFQELSDRRWPRPA
jgi:hypothetical protein